MTKLSVISNTFYTPVACKSVENLFTNMDYTPFNIVDHKHDKLYPEIVVFTGGADVNPRLYEEEPLGTTYTDLRRDALDLKVWDVVRPYGQIMKIGICRGGQFLNVMNGGSLWQDVNNHGRAHMMTDLFITNTELKVSSTHHQMMIPNYDEGIVLGISDEATSYRSPSRSDTPAYDTEIVYYPRTNSLCFQPHPEYENYGECGRLLFDIVDRLKLIENHIETVNTVRT